jgi:hypothetical protein
MTELGNKTKESLQGHITMARQIQRDDTLLFRKGELSGRRRILIRELIYSSYPTKILR